MKAFLTNLSVRLGNGFLTAVGVLLTLSVAYAATSSGTIWSPGNSPLAAPGVGNVAAPVTYDGDGNVKISQAANGSTTCTAAKAGSIRWNGTTFEGCYGSEWKALGGVSGGGGVSKHFTELLVCPDTKASCTLTWDKPEGVTSVKFTAVGGGGTGDNGGDTDGNQFKGDPGRVVTESIFRDSAAESFTITIGAPGYDGNSNWSLGISGGPTIVKAISAMNPYTLTAPGGGGRGSDSQPSNMNCSDSAGGTVPSAFTPNPSVGRGGHGCGEGNSVGHYGGTNGGVSVDYLKIVTGDLGTSHTKDFVCADKKASCTLTWNKPEGVTTIGIAAVGGGGSGYNRGIGLGSKGSPGVAANQSLTRDAAAETFYITIGAPGYDGNSGWSDGVGGGSTVIRTGSVSGPIVLTAPGGDGGGGGALDSSSNCSDSAGGTVPSAFTPDPSVGRGGHGCKEGNSTGYYGGTNGGAHFEWME